MKKIIIFLIIVVAIIAIVWHRSAEAAPMAQPHYYCPSPSALKKNPNPTIANWTAQTRTGFWKSYQQSFATRITHFVGAQWNGVNVGQITCVYHSQQQFTENGQIAIQPTLPILLVFHTLTYQPTKGKWEYIKKQNVYNCYSRNRHDCPFRIRTKKHTGNIYQEAESLKDKSSHSTSSELTNY